MLRIRCSLSKFLAQELQHARHRLTSGLGLRFCVSLKDVFYPVGGNTAHSLGGWGLWAVDGDSSGDLRGQEALAKALRAAARRAGVRASGVKGVIDFTLELFWLLDREEG